MPDAADTGVPFTDREALLFLFGGFEAMRASIAPERSAGAQSISAIVRRHLYRQYGWPDEADADLMRPQAVFTGRSTVVLMFEEQDAIEVARLASEAGLPAAADIVREAMRIGVWAIKAGIATPRPASDYERPEPTA